LTAVAKMSLNVALLPMIIETIVVGRYATNCYIVASETSRRGIIIDPGAQAGAILDAVEQSGISISLITLTHRHIDHLAALRTVKRKTGAEFVTFDTKDISRWVRMFMPPPFSSLWLPHPDLRLKEGDTIDIDDLHFTVLHTPGHSPDGISLLGHGVVFTGDALFKGVIGRTDLPAASYRQLVHSINDKLLILPDDTVVYPGHGSQTTIGQERKNNPFLR